MSRLDAHQKSLYEIRFSPMCKPAGEVANLTQNEIHTTRARMMMLWRIQAGHLEWGRREAEMLYQCTLDSISEAFDIYHYPVSRIMLDARAETWELGLAPEPVRIAVEKGQSQVIDPPPALPSGKKLLLGGEIAQLGKPEMLKQLEDALGTWMVFSAGWLAPSGALAYALGDWELARQQAQRVIDGLQASGAQTVIADGPETAWALKVIYPSLDLALPDGVQVKLASELLAIAMRTHRPKLGKVMVHDSRPAYFLADRLPSHLAVLPGYTEDEAAFGDGSVYVAPRKLADDYSQGRLFGAWTRGLAKSCGADDGLWLTYPELAAGLAAQRLEYAKDLGAESIVTDSPLSADFLKSQRGADDLPVYWLPELVV